MSHRFVFMVSVSPIRSVCLFAQGYDGPAELPIATVASSMVDIPAPGAVITVNAPFTSLNDCFSMYTFANNALVAAPSHFSPSTGPTGNFFTAGPNDVGLVQHDDGNGGNYELVQGSPYKNMGTDGKDLGADIVGLDQAFNGSRMSSQLDFDAEVRSLPRTLFLIRHAANLPSH
jgi:hypothetical protein